MICTKLINLLRLLQRLKLQNQSFIKILIIQNSKKKVRFKLQMLKQGGIELDKRQIQSIQQRQNERIQELRRLILQNGQFDKNKQIDKEIEYELVRQQIFPTQFIPFCINKNSKQSSLKLYKLQRSKYDIDVINLRLKKVYEVLNIFRQSNQKEKIIQILRINQLKHLVDKLNLKQQEFDQYFGYFEYGIELQKVEIQQFRHKQDKPNLIYEERQEIFNKFIMLVRFISHLSKIQQLNHVKQLTLNNILICQYQNLNQLSNEYQLKIKLKWLLDMILNTKPIKAKQFDLLQNSRKILRKILCISEQKQKRQQMDEINYKNIQYMISFDDIIKLNYQDIYPSKQARNKKNIIKQNQHKKQQQNKQQLQKLRQHILLLQEQIKKQLKNNNINIKSNQPKIKQTTKQSNKLFWSTIQKYILNNITQSQRINIINQVQKKSIQQPNSIKKLQKKSIPSSASKKQAKSQNKQIKKDQKDKSKNKQITKENKQTKKQTKDIPSKENRNKQQQPTRNINKIPTQKLIVIQAIYLSSASNLKFKHQKLISLIQTKQSLLYILKLKNTNHQVTHNLACFINAKLSKQNLNMFGTYISDPTKKSFIYSLSNDKFYKLNDKNYAVGYGPQIFISFGKLDIIVPCFGTQIIDDKQMMKCMSYFPISYSAKGIQIDGLQKIEQEDPTDQNENIQNKQNQIGINKEFYLQEIDIYEIKLKAQ